MPQKSIRDMNKFERLHYSLAARTFHSVLIGALVLGLVTLVVGLGLYAVAVTDREISSAYNLSRNALTITEKVIPDLKPLADKVMSEYRAMTDEEKNAVGTDEYFSHFDIADDPDYQMLLGILSTFRESSDVFDIYFAMFDAEKSAVVYIADPDTNPESACPPGFWETVEAREVKKFLASDGGKVYDIGNTDRYGWLCTSGVPVKDTDGNIIAFFLADVSLGEVVSAMNNFILQYTLALIVVMLVVGFLLTGHMKRTLVNPINKIADAAQMYVNDRKNGELTGNHFSDLKINTGDEIENLALLMADMEEEMISYVENLTKVTAEKERINTELSLATRIQADMLPNIYPAFPDRPEFDICATMTPAKEVGGDFYDFFLIDDSHLGIVMADVSGKGVPAALFMMASKILIQNHAMMSKSPAEVLEKVNNQICANNREEMFVTVWLGVLDIETGVITAANAGHEYPIIKHPGQDYEIIRDKHGFVIGGMSGVRYKEYEIKLEKGAQLFLYTDGVTEATDPGNVLFGTDRTIAALNINPNDTTQGILRTVKEQIDAFADGAPQFDDITMLCIRYIGREDK